MSRVSVGVYLLIVSLYWMLVTRFTGELIATEWLGSVYDSLGEHLLHLNAEVDQDAIRWERLTVNNKTYAYFGPFPAFVRIILNAMMPQFRGQWSRVSCLLAAALSVLAVSLMAKRVAAENKLLSRGRREVLCALLTLGFAFGTPIAYLISCARIYHEGILWGLCGAMWCVCAVALLLLPSARTSRTLFLFSTGVFVALLSRITFGVPVVLASPAVLLLTGGASWWKNRGSLVRRSILCAPTVAALAIGAWYNYARFGSPFTFFDYSGFYLRADSIGGEFNMSRLPDSLSHYFGFNLKYFSWSPPFIRMVTSEYLRPELFVRGWREQTIPYTIASSWLVLLAILGLSVSPRVREKKLFFSFQASLAVQVGLIVSFYFITERYATEFIPFLIFLLLPWLSQTHGSWRFITVIGLMVVWSSYATVASVLDWNMVHNGDTDLRYKRLLASVLLPRVRLSDYSGEVVYLSDVTPIQESTSFAPVARDRNVKGEPLEVGGEQYPKGLGMHAHSRVTYAVPAGKSAFAAIVAPSLSELRCEKMSYRVRVSDTSGQVLLESGIFRSRTPPVPVEIELGGASAVVLEVDPLEDGIDCDHANWVMAQFR